MEEMVLRRVFVIAVFLFEISFCPLLCLELLLLFFGGRDPAGKAFGDEVRVFDHRAGIDVKDRLADLDAFGDLLLLFYVRDELICPFAERVEDLKPFAHCS